MRNRLKTNALFPAYVAVMTEKGTTVESNLTQGECEQVLALLTRFFGQSEQERAAGGGDTDDP